MLRTPLLPFDELLQWSNGVESPECLNDFALLQSAFVRDRHKLRNTLCALMSRPEVRDALFLASPDLDESFEIWLSDPESKRGQRSTLR